MSVMFNTVKINGIYCHDPVSHLAMDVSSCMKVQMNHCVKYVNTNSMFRSIIIFFIPSYTSNIIFFIRPLYLINL